MATNTCVASTSTPKHSGAPAPIHVQSNQLVTESPIVRPKSQQQPKPTGVNKPKTTEKHENKRRREDTHSSIEGDGSAGTSMLDTSEMTVQHDKLKQMIDHAVQDAIGAAMKVVSVRLEASLKNIFTEQFDRLESRVFDIEHKVDTEVRKVNESIRSHKTETNKIINDHETRIYDNEKDIFARGNDIYDIELKCNDLEQYTRRNSIRIHGMPEKSLGASPENTSELVSDLLYNKLELETDIEVAHRVGVKGRNPKNPRSKIVKFLRRSDKRAVMLRRKLLKGSKISISDDLTSRNVNLIKEARDHNRIEAVWSWDGKVYAKGVNGHKFLLRPNTDIDIELEKGNKGD